MKFASTKPGLCPGPRLGRSRGPHSPLRSLAGAPCAPRPLCDQQSEILVTRRITAHYSKAIRIRHVAVHFSFVLVASTGWLAISAQQKAVPGGYILERDRDVARQEPGTHDGGGQTVGYSFFSKAPDLKLVFRKRALKPGSGIGYHEQKEDEIYYVLSGRGQMTIDGKAFDVGPGDAILTRPGSSHGLKQTGDEDLVIMINYGK
jgi:mannose-6-phosphate isomerase-like protein (cupin superfamily)